MGIFVYAHKVYLNISIRIQAFSLEEANQILQEVVKDTTLYELTVTY
jgi:hypothetical protein